MPHNAICHIEIPCADSGKSSRFYSDLFGWKLDNSMGDEYIFFMTEGGQGGAFSRTENMSPGSSIVFYVEVDDIEAYLKKAVELGGKEAMVKTEISGHGWYGQFTDHDGNLIGLFTGMPKK